eukprot:9277191-Ditylum_brightwellii.AAC.1
MARLMPQVGGGLQFYFASFVVNCPAFALSKNQGIDNTSTNITGIDKEESANSEGGENQHQATNQRRDSLPAGSTCYLEDGSSCAKSKHESMVWLPTVEGSMLPLGDHESNLAGGSGPKTAKAEDII